MEKLQNLEVRGEFKVNLRTQIIRNVKMLQEVNTEGEEMDGEKK